MSFGDPIDEKFTSGSNYSYWNGFVQPLMYNTLQSNVSTDVLIIGGGIAGLTTAYSLDHYRQCMKNCTLL